MKQKFQPGDHVIFSYSMFNASVYWVVVNPKPDALGRIVLSSPRSNEYTVAYQDDMKEAP